MLRIADAPLPSEWRQHATLPPRQDFWSEIRTGFAILLRWLERSRQRQDLDKLNDDQLRDIGLTRGDIRRECSKPFWRK
jgi:uncharacterized protein YjiS (DUF1127 family)